MKALLALLLFLPWVVQAQDSEPTTLEPVVVRAPRHDLFKADPFAFHNPIDYQPTRFDQYWQETSPEQFALSGGVVPWLNRKIAEGVSTMAHKAGWKQQVQPAVARPSPLTEEQLERAAQQ